jgi:hypothetical protein
METSFFGKKLSSIFYLMCTPSPFHLKTLLPSLLLFIYLFISSLFNDFFQ